MNADEKKILLENTNGVTSPFQGTVGKKKKKKKGNANRHGIGMPGANEVNVTSAKTSAAAGISPAMHGKPTVH
ncbi:hypothetical protein CEXT_40391 [Caerostris extrusa]|uniref:Uncharacterized protein n=1 Tax=Caerostris extrusa TaxID=172846 RepID=A0AAV4Y8P3_CAEEX|nr:hypothetical protein CEXT_40391 [Caerostris extrusa]